ncbi:MAG: hypothetical protein RIT04_542 [Candidatus Parcubacteria bacterium]|jgi:hypothetical protein
MKNLFKKSNSTQHASVKKNSSFLSKVGNDVHTDWVIICFITLCAVLFLANGGVRLFLGISDGSIGASQAQISTQTRVLNPSDLTKLTSALSKRQADFDVIKNTPYVTSGDPMK